MQNYIYGKEFCPLNRIKNNYLKLAKKKKKSNFRVRKEETEPFPNFPFPECPGDREKKISFQRKGQAGIIKERFYDSEVPGKRARTCLRLERRERNRLTAPP